MSEQLGLLTEPATPIAAPPGLLHLARFVDGEAQAALLAHVAAAPWIDDLSRRVQHYGFRYDYKARRIRSDMRIGPIPEWLADVARSVADAGAFDRVPDQVIVNEYEPGQGIAAHTDCEPCFGPTVATLSLGSGAEMRFRSRIDGAIVDRYLEPGSLVVMNGPARFSWTHEIAKRQSDVVRGGRVPRRRRVSLTFRTVLIE